MCGSAFYHAFFAPSGKHRIIAVPKHGEGPLKNVHPSIREVAVLQESTEMILSSMDVDTVLHQILLVVRNYFATANAAVFLVDPATRELYCRAHIGYNDVFADQQRVKIGPEG